MPRNYVPKPGAKRYKKYDDQVMKGALHELASTNNSLSTVAEKYNITKSVLFRHKKQEIKPHGGQTALTKEEELYIVENLNVCGDWGYPLDTTDLRYIIKMYLDSVNIKNNRFKNNMPGIDYVNRFLKRHEVKISQKICQNIKRSRAAVSPDTIKEYFGELEKSLENVPTQNIIIYDETNLTDNPGCKKVIVRRGCKYPERIVTHSKGSISLMMSATADGDVLPPYVVYKAAHLYDSWTTKGPQNARYNRSSSGWFDGDTFKDWVKSIVIPFLEEREGKKILIGDNLSSHLTIDVIKLCQEKDIHFVFLPANSTHLTQPLDEAVFRPMKMIWRHVLDEWKKSDDGRLQSCVPKGCFPQMLKMLIDELSVNVEQNIRAGFKKCGILPLDVNQVLSRLPLQEENGEAKLSALNDSFLTLLKTKKIMITGDGEIYEIDDNVTKQEPATHMDQDTGSEGWPYNNDETDALDNTEYLDETIFNEPKPSPAKKIRFTPDRSFSSTQPVTTTITTQPVTTTITTQPVTTTITTQPVSKSIHNDNRKSTQEGEDCPLDFFGKYMTSLLKELPKQKSDKLQVDIIRLIMEAQENNCQNTSNVNNSYQNTRTLSVINIRSPKSIDDTITSNSDVQRVLPSNGEQLVVENEIIVSSGGNE